MAVITVYWHNLFDFALRIKNNAGFRRFKIYSAALRSSFAQQLIKIVQMMQVWKYVGILSRQAIPGLGIWPLQHIADFVVSKPRMAAHNRLIESVPTDVASCANGHVCHHAEAIHIGVQ